MRPDSYSETSQVNSSCLDASYEHACACSTQSPKRILPLSYFILQPERGYKSFDLKVCSQQDHAPSIRFVYNLDFVQALEVTPVYIAHALCHGFSRYTRGEI